MYETGELKGDYSPWFQLITLGPTGINHFWTVPVEFRYYFFIPPFCLAFYAAGRKYFDAMLAGCLFFAYYMFSWLAKLSKSDLEAHFFWSKFPIFFAGSFIAALLFRIQLFFSSSSHGPKTPSTLLTTASTTSSTTSSMQMQTETKSIKTRSFFRMLGIITNHHVFKNMLGIVTLSLYLYGYRMFSSKINSKSQHIVDLNMASLYLLVMLICFLWGSPNFLTHAFSRNYLFTLAAKYSLGIYLLHPICLLAKPLYYDKLKESGEAVSTLEMALVAVFATFVIGHLFYYLVENPSMKCSQLAVKRVKQVLSSL